MGIPAYIQKSLRIKPEVHKIFDDLEKWHDYCRFNLVKFDPADLYRSIEYKAFQRKNEYLERKARREAEGRPEPIRTREPFKGRNNDRFSR
jgi:hypothetical protein